MFIPLSPDFEGLTLKERYPVVNLLLLALTAAFSAAVWQGLIDVDAVALWRGDAFSPFQLLSHAFVHANWRHLIGNGICLFAFGNALNRRLGHGPYLLLYLSLCLLGGVSWWLFDGGVAAIGASGVAMGLGGVFLVAFPRLPMNVLVPFIGYVLYGVAFVTAITRGGATLLGPLAALGRLTELAVLLAAIVIVALIQLRYLVGVSRIGAPPEGYLLALLGWRAWKLAGCWVAPALLIGDVIALSVGLPDRVAHGAHLGGAAAGVLLGLLLCGGSLLQGSHAQPTLPEWLLGTTPPPQPAGTRPQQHPPTTRRRRTTPTAALSYSDFRRQRLELQSVGSQRS